ncbi:hypothetical protein FD754_012843, partial [Muntiacus muntjak]
KKKKGKKKKKGFVLNYVTFFVSFFCHLKYLYLCLGLHNHAEGRHSNLASQYGPFASVVSLVDDRRAGEYVDLSICHIMRKSVVNRTQKIMYLDLVSNPYGIFTALKILCALPVNFSPPHLQLWIFYFFPPECHIVGIIQILKSRDITFPTNVCLYLAGLSLESYAVSIVQLLGLNVGMSYDNTEICHCSGDICTMSPEALQSGGVKDFSTCSLDDFKYFAAYSGIECLHKILPDEPVYKQRKVCGNGILETGEQCDCGTAKECTHPACCDARTCLKKKDKVCGSGACCTTDCKIKPLNTLCRKAVDECDFEEFCNGNQSVCVPDTYARDGELCESGDAYCYQGRCRSVNRQCSRVLGAGSRGAPYACYDEINARADRYGNCGREICKFSQSMCGKLVCAWPYKTLISRANLSVIYTHVRDEICASGFLNAEKLPRDTFTTVQAPEDRDETFVEDGSICGPDMICNNFNHCHCSPGFAPPNCKPLSGEFGSIDDGHTHKTGKSFLKERSLGHPKRRLQLVFYISIPVFIIAAALIIKQDKIRELCYKGELESESQEKSIYS